MGRAGIGGLIERDLDMGDRDMGSGVLIGASHVLYRVSSRIAVDRYLLS